MPVLFRDIETRSTLDLADVGAWRYAADPTTEVLCVAYAVDDGPVNIWTPGQADTRRIQDCGRLIRIGSLSPTIPILSEPSKTRLLHSRYGWPLVPLAQHRCTLAAALANALPGSLDAAAAALGLVIPEGSRRPPADDADVEAAQGAQGRRPEHRPLA